MGKTNYKYKIYNGKIIKELIRKSDVFIFTLIFICGIIFGAYYSNHADLSALKKISEICTSYILSLIHI